MDKELYSTLELALLRYLCGELCRRGVITSRQRDVAEKRLCRLGERTGKPWT